MLCHPQCRLVSFPSDERQFVLTLNEFCTRVTKRTGPDVRFPDTPPKWSYRSADPLKDASAYERFFSLDNPHVKQRRARLHGFQQTSTAPDYSHPKGIWAEFNAEHMEIRSSKALFRKWDFSKLSGGATTAAERESIGLRENRINESLRSQAPELHIDLLEPVGSGQFPITSPQTSLRPTNSLTGLSDCRSSSHVGQTSRTPTGSAIAQATLARFAKLHSLGIAHRDITPKTLWIVEPARVILSSFAAARGPLRQALCWRASN